MCLTLNSATECAGSMAQVLIAVCGAVAVVAVVPVVPVVPVVAVDMVLAPFASLGLDAL
jgi:hypothetical protein